uniref:Uncharacterized protein n=1 Tax=Rhizophora mucronata TaxID=61149 RepID=A0A2P2MFW2_RHIMU
MGKDSIDHQKNNIPFTYLIDQPR